MSKFCLSLSILCSFALISTMPINAQEGSSHRQDPYAKETSSSRAEGSSHAGPRNIGFRKVTEAIAYINPTQGNSASGTVKFLRKTRSVQIIADIKGLTPNSKHAFHIHEFGDCSSTDGKSAGGHYNPTAVNHSGPDNAERHAGDLGNLTADENGNVHYELTVDNISLGGRKSPIIGRAVIIHAGEDDFKTQPTGNAGARIGCGLIGIAKVSK